MVSEQPVEPPHLVEHPGILPRTVGVVVRVHVVQRRTDVVSLSFSITHVAEEVTGRGCSYISWLRQARPSPRLESFHHG